MMITLHKYTSPSARLIVLAEVASLCLGSDETPIGGNGGGIPAATQRQSESIWDNRNNTLE